MRPGFLDGDPPAGLAGGAGKLNRCHPALRVKKTLTAG
jgi:hypothetical protein